MANYAIDPQLLLPYLPAKTEVDLWNGVCYVSLVGFMFVNTRVLGVPIPFHRDFEEINLRFYVRHQAGGEWKRGVVFIKEIVPKAALTLVANALYHEHYETMPTRHRWQVEGECLEVEYGWRKERWNSFRIKTEKDPMDLPADSEEEFITEHFWGYTKLSEDRTAEYPVEHPRWQIYRVRNYEIEVDYQNVYGPEFSFLTNEKPRSVFLAEGSEIAVGRGNTI